MLDWIQSNIPPWFWLAFIVHGVTLGTVAYLILLERKVASWVQDRIGPNRVGLGFGIIPFLKDKKMFGLGQPLADGLKFILKEDYRPKGVDVIMFTLAPAIMIVTVIISIAVIPWGGTKQTTCAITSPTTAVESAVEDLNAKEAVLDRKLKANNGAFSAAEINDARKDVAIRERALKIARSEQVAAVVPPGVSIVSQTASTVTYRYPFQIADVNIGVLYVLAILSLAVYGVVIGGWASNNKYSFLGGLRVTANMISYEIPLGLCVLCIVLMFGSLSLGDIVNKQTHYWGGFVPAWNVFTQPIAFFLFLVCIHAEANRAPFDLAEAEQELVGGYHTEYSSMRFALFFLAEYAGMITTSCVLVALFFGGWHLPWLEFIPGLSQNPLGDPDKSVTTSLFVCILRAIVFFSKAIVVLFVFMWVRWSLPRFRFDQLMSIAWRGLIPITLALVAMTAVLVYVTRGRTFDGTRSKDALLFLGANVVLGIVIMIAARMLPTAPDTNRRIKVEGSRFNPAPVAST